MATASDLGQRITAALLADGAQSDRAIARTLSCSPKSVARYRAQLPPVASSALPPSWATNPAPVRSALALLADALAAGDPPWPELPAIPALEPGTTAGERLRQYRESALLSVAELASASGVTEPGASAVEAGTSEAADLRRCLARGLAAMDQRLDAGQVAAELLSLPPTPRSADWGDQREQRAQSRMADPEAVNATRHLRLTREAERAAREAAAQRNEQPGL